ncbi:MAG: hypothetical protein ACTJLK_02280 [Anaplasma sp.]
MIEVWVGFPTPGGVLFTKSADGGVMSPSVGLSAAVAALVSNIAFFPIVLVFAVVGVAWGLLWALPRSFIGRPKELKEGVLADREIDAGLAVRGAEALINTIDRLPPGLCCGLRHGSALVSGAAGAEGRVGGVREEPALQCLSSLGNKIGKVDGGRPLDRGRGRWTEARGAVATEPQQEEGRCGVAGRPETWSRLVAQLGAGVGQAAEGLLEGRSAAVGLLVCIMVVLEDWYTARRLLGGLVSQLNDGKPTVEGVTSGSVVRNVTCLASRPSGLQLGPGPPRTRLWGSVG